MAETKQGGKSSASRSSKGTTRSGGTKGRSSASKRSTSSNSRSTSNNSRSTPNRSQSSSRRSTSASRNGRRSDSGVTATIKQIANDAKGPAVAVGAAAAGIAGGLALKNRMRRKTVLGVPVPRSLSKAVSGFDAKSVAKSVGQASKQFAKTTKNVSKDLERAGDQAERIGKILD